REKMDLLTNTGRTSTIMSPPHTSSVSTSHENVWWTQRLIQQLKMALDSSSSTRASEAFI
ncbi:hypothetical protein PanWU01x14_178330, partial [Parasponia andersonii]